MSQETAVRFGVRFSRVSAVVQCSVMRSGARSVLHGAGEHRAVQGAGRAPRRRPLAHSARRLPDGGRDGRRARRLLAHTGYAHLLPLPPRLPLLPGGPNLLLPCPDLS